LQNKPSCLALACALTVASAALADTAIPAPTLDLSPAAAPFTQTAGSDAHLTVAPYIWLTGLSGHISARQIEFHPDLSFSDILEDTDHVIGFMGAVDLEINRFVFEFNGAWTRAQADGSRAVTRNGTLGADVQLNNAILELFGGYRVLESPPDREVESNGHAALDLFGGVRYTNINLDTTLTATNTITLPNGEVLTSSQSKDWDASKDWFEPFIGARLQYEVTEHWVLTLRGDVGGFGIDGSDFSWQAVGLVGYQWHVGGWDLTVFGGYRALGQDYSKGEFSWDMITHGPVLGAAATWSF
jgi:hypothetical protein